MTKENSKRLYDHFVKEGMDKSVKDILKHFPEFKVKVEEPKLKETKKHGKRPKR